MAVNSIEGATKLKHLRMRGAALPAALLMLLLVGAIAQDGGKGPDSRKEAREKRRQEHEERANADGPDLHHGVREMRSTPEDREARHTASALFAALIEPRTPKEVSFPLSEEDEAKFHASREGLMEWAVTAAGKHDLRSKKVKSQLRDKTTSNHDATRKILVEAVNKGATLQQARVGLIIAQFDALPEQAKTNALEKSKLRMAKMPQGAREKARNRQLSKHNEEKEQLKALATGKHVLLGLAVSILDAALQDVCRRDQEGLQRMSVLPGGAGECESSACVAPAFRR